MTASQRTSRSYDFLPLFAEPFDAERDHVADVEKFRRLHAHADPGRRAGRDDVARHQRQDLREVGNDLLYTENHGCGRPGLAALAVDVGPHRQLLHVRDLVLGHEPGTERAKRVMRPALGPLTEALD